MGMLMRDLKNGLSQKLVAESSSSRRSGKCGEFVDLDIDVGLLTRNLSPLLLEGIG
jgi:hypothetical protein